jgi:hypothetical protein
MALTSAREQADVMVPSRLVARSRRLVEALRPWHVGVLGGLMALAIVWGRMMVPADGDISRFVVAGDVFVNPDTVDPPIYVYENSWGYDGQFFWRLAVDPTNWELGTPHHGVTFDSAYRPPRILYPVLAWSLAGGHAEWVAATLVLVNVLAYGVIALLGAMVAERAGRPALSGLLIASTSGLVFALSRDLSDVVTLAALLAGVVALQRGRPGWATVAWTCAVLSREQAVLVIAGYGLWRLVALVRRQVRFSIADLPWIVPPVVVTLWQALLWARIGELPVASADDGNITAPFTVLVPTAFGWLHGDTQPWDDVVPFQFVLAVVLVGLAMWRGRTLLRADDRWLIMSLGLVLLLAVSLGEKVWDGPADLRQVLDVLALSWVVLLSCPRRIPPVLVIATAGVWLATAAVRVYAI